MTISLIFDLLVLSQMSVMCLIHKKNWKVYSKYMVGEYTARIIINQVGKIL